MATPAEVQLNKDIKADVASMQAKGNYGDGESIPHLRYDLLKAKADLTGFWSDGQRLKDSVKMGAEGLSGRLSPMLQARSLRARAERLPRICLRCHFRVSSCLTRSL